ncbi:hypothetical protein ASE08_15360 [Rhizobacter sp. Root16D2]|nr:hypothetical protein ASC88_01295 [Rhizobacter sp. Root29]KQW12128.1 hypothetical protein ASC98_20275 [Rhizobacter sp. Root1238]KRB02943.1 hypothetical protein ASE08_15360 [Rhizobacter sp. Root16D2]
MAHIDTSHEDPCVQTFQAQGVMPDPATRAGAADAQLVLHWCADHGLDDLFLMGAKAFNAQAQPPGVSRYRGQGIDLEFEDIAAEERPFFIGVLPGCPEITGIELPIPSDPEQAAELAQALGDNIGLNSLKLHVDENAPPEAGALVRLFSHPTARARPLAELEIIVTAAPADLDAGEWKRRLCSSLSTHLMANAACLTLPWCDELLGWLMEASQESPCLSSLELRGNLQGCTQLRKLVVDALQHPDCKLRSLSFANAAFNQALADALIGAVETNTSLLQLHLGDTELTNEAFGRLTAALQRNQALARQAFQQRHGLQGVFSGLSQM